MPRVLLIGAGISGLATAYRLQAALPSAELILLEREHQSGGTISTAVRDGFRIERGPNGFLDTKLSTLALCRDLGLGERLVHATEAAARNRYLFLDGKLKPLPGSFGSFLRTDLLSLGGKLRLLTERFRRPRKDGGDESIDAFARRRAGDQAAEVFADALVTGIHAGDPALLSMPAAFPGLVELEAKHGSLMKGMAAVARERRMRAAAQGKSHERPGKMWSFREGLGLLVETLTGQLTQAPLCGVRVRRLERQNQRWLVHAEGRDAWAADSVVLACPAYEQAEILAEFDPELAVLLSGIAYNRIAVVALGYRAADIPGPVDGFGFIAPQRTRRDLLGVQWCSSIYPGRAPEGMVLLRAMCGGWHRPEQVDWDDARLVAAVRAELRLAMGIEAAPVMQYLVRWDRAIPQYHLGHLERIRQIDARVARYPGLFLTGNAFQGVAMNDCTEQAEILAARIAAPFC